MQLSMTPKISKKVQSKVAQEKAIPKQGQSSQGEKCPSSSQQPPISPTSKKSRKKHNVLAEEQFNAHKFVDL